MDECRLVDDSLLLEFVDDGLGVLLEVSFLNGAGFVLVEFGKGLELGYDVSVEEELCEFAVVGEVVLGEGDVEVGDVPRVGDLGGGLDEDGVAGGVVVVAFEVEGGLLGGSGVQGVEEGVVLDGSEVEEEGFGLD